MKKSKYTESAILFSNLLLIALGVTIVWILVTFSIRIIKHDYTTTNIRNIQIMLMPKEWDFKTKNYLGITGENPNAYLRYVHGAFETHNSPMGLFIFVHLYDLFFFSVLFYGIYLLRKFLKSIHIEKVFTVDNIKLLKNLSKMALYIPLVDIALLYVLWFFLKDVSFAPDTRVAFNSDFFSTTGIYFALIFFGYIMGVVIKILEDGIIIKQENDLTV